MTTNVQGLRFHVRHADGRAEVLTVDSDHALIGSGAHCEIRLPVAQASVEHVEVTMGGGGVYAQSRAIDRPPTLNGVAFEQSPIHGNDVLGIGQTQIQIAIVDIEDNPNVIKKKTQKTSPMTYVLAILAVPLAVYVLMTDDDQRTGGGIPKEVPELWGPPVTTCPVTDPDQAMALGLEKRVLADAKRERRPFHVQDGVAAVPLYETASACFKIGGDGDRSTDADQAAQDLRAKVGEDYRAHQVRLEHALVVQDLPTAQKEVKVLRDFTDGLQGPYVVWLGNLERQLQLKLGEKKS